MRRRRLRKPRRSRTESRTKKCRRCQNYRDIAMFKKDGRICKLCRDQAKEAGDLTTWDWAKAIRKATYMHISKAEGRLGVYMESLTAPMLRALMEYQYSCCAVSGMRFCLPDPDIVLPSNSTLKQWLESIPRSELLRTPVLARVSSSGNWEPGNVIFIAKFLEPLYTMGESLYGLHALVDAIKDKGTPEIPQVTVLRKIIRRSK